jgi:hypothetical protein
MGDKASRLLHEDAAWPEMAIVANCRLMRTLTIELSDDLLTRLAAASRDRRVSSSQIVATALERALPARAGDQAGPSALEELGDLAGCFDSGMSDLATNPKYLENFGQWQR